MVELLERVLDNFLRDMIYIGSWQFGLVPGQGTTNAVFLTRLLQEKYIAAYKPLYLAFLMWRRPMEEYLGKSFGKR